MRLLLKFVKSFLTPEKIKELKEEAKQYCTELAQKTDNQLDDALVEIFFDALD